MSDVYDAIAKICAAVHSDRIRAAARKIASLDDVTQFPTVRTAFGPTADESLIRRLEKAWKENETIRPHEIAAALLGAAAVMKFRSEWGETELVWSGPSTGLISVRHTEQVMCELIDSARTRLFIVSFVAYEVDSILKAVQKAVERNVAVNILLESSMEYGGRVNHDSIASLKSNLKSVHFYTWLPGSKELQGKEYSVVHAKCAVADGNLALITSANLTSAAMERNMELGILIRGGDLPTILHRHLDALITTKLITKV